MLLLLIKRILQIVNSNLNNKTIFFKTKKDKCNLVRIKYTTNNRTLMMKLIIHLKT